MHRCLADRRPSQWGRGYSMRYRLTPPTPLSSVIIQSWQSGTTAGPGQNAYYSLMINLFDGSFTLDFDGVRVFALDRACMLSGWCQLTPLALHISLAGLGDSYSFVAATFRTAAILLQ